MLLAPDGAATSGNDLGGQQTVYSTLHAVASARPNPRGDKGIIARSISNLPQEIEHLDHGIVIIGYCIVITALQWPDLRPAAVRVLGGKNIIETFHERLSIDCSLPWAGRSDHSCQISKLGGGCVVVEGADI